MDRRKVVCTKTSLRDENNRVIYHRKGAYMCKKKSKTTGKMVWYTAKQVSKNASNVGGGRLGLFGSKIYLTQQEVEKNLKSLLFFLMKNIFPGTNMDTPITEEKYGDFKNYQQTQVQASLAPENPIAIDQLIKATQEKLTKFENDKNPIIERKHVQELDEYQKLTFQHTESGRKLELHATIHSVDFDGRNVPVYTILKKNGLIELFFIEILITLEDNKFRKVLINVFYDESKKVYTIFPLEFFTDANGTIRGLRFDSTRIVNDTTRTLNDTTRTVNDTTLLYLVLRNKLAMMESKEMQEENYVILNKNSIDKNLLACFSKRKSNLEKFLEGFPIPNLQIEYTEPKIVMNPENDGEYEYTYTVSVNKSVERSNEIPIQLKICKEIKSVGTTQDKHEFLVTYTMYDTTVSETNPFYEETRDVSRKNNFMMYDFSY